MAVDIWEGALAPEKYELVISSTEDDGIDLSTVSAAQFIVRAPNGTESTWSATFTYNATTGKLTVSKTFHATTSELNAVGMWLVYAKLTVPSGTARSRPRPIYVRSRFESLS